MAEKKQRITTPAGEAFFPRLNKPDFKFNKAGQYKTDLLLKTDDTRVQKFIQFIKGLEKEAQAEAFQSPKNKKFTLNSVLKEHTDKDGETVEGVVKVSFKTTASGVREDGSKWERKVQLFDAKGLPASVNVGSGSTIKVSFTYAPYVNPSAKNYGISLYLEAVQVIDLVEFNGAADASSYGFSEEEGSFESSGKDFSDDAEDSAEDEASDDDAGDEPMSEEEHEEAAEEEAPKAPKSGAKRPRGQF